MAAGLAVIGILGVAAPSLRAEPSPVAVEVVAVARGTLEQHLYTDGTAHALRREILQFDREGRVVQIGLDADGGLLREGSVVRGPRGDEPGDLIAVLGDGTLAEDLDARAARERAMGDRAQAAAAAVTQAEERLRATESSLRRTETLVGQGAMPGRALEEARTAAVSARGDLMRAQAELRAARADAEAAAAERQGVLSTLQEGILRAPFDGVIALLNVREGSRVGPLPSVQSDADRLRLAPVVVVALDAFEIVAEVPWSQAMALHPGQRAAVTWAGQALFDDLDGRRAAGASVDGLPVAEAEVWAVAPTVLPDTRAMRVRLRTTGYAPALRNALRDGLFVTIRIAARTIEDVLALPREAVQHGGGMAFVYVLEANDPPSDDGGGGVVRRRVVTTGAESRDLVQVLDGLTEGEVVVTRGQARLMDGARVRIVGRTPQT